MARKGAGQVGDDRRGGGVAAASERAAQRGPTEIWIDEGVVADEAARAVGRGRRPATRGARSQPDDEVVDDPSLARAVGPTKVARFEERMKEATRAFRRERFEEARRLLKPLADAAPTALSVRELLGLTYYRLGKWKLAVAELEAFRDLADGSTEQHPVLADCYRALGRHAMVDELWEELRAASPSAALVAEGRIVLAGSLADRADLPGAIRLLEGAKVPQKRPQDHHLRIAYALADLYERVGDVPRARQLFTTVVAADPDLGDAALRLRALD